MVDRAIPAFARTEIKRRLQAIETDFNVRIILACESGSRAWGFASPDSDYDVRFIYVHPSSWYLAVDLEEKRDVIETPIEDVWDINGWDLRKALRLFRKSNPPLLEWLQSPIIYRQQGSAAEQLRNLFPTYYSPSACHYHYLHMAQKNFRTYLQGDEVWVKKYFYVLRPLLACRWLERDLGAVPMEFEHLVQNVELSTTLNQAIANLIEEKRLGAELRKGPRIPIINDFIATEFNRFNATTAIRHKPNADVSALNLIFQKTLQEIE